MLEIWKDIKEYEGLYQVSNLGRIRSLDKYRKGKNNTKVFVKGRILKQNKDKDGYLQVNLSKNNKQKTFKSHRLVAMAFLINKNNLPQVNHKDENRQNNCVSNLEWCTEKYNCRYSHCKKIICLTTGKIFNSIVEGGEYYNINSKRIVDCLKGRLKTYKGLSWDYLKEVI